MTSDGSGEDPHGHDRCAARDDELDALAASPLRVQDQVGLDYARNHVFGRISVQAYGGTVTRAERG